MHEQMTYLKTWSRNRRGYISSMGNMNISLEEYISRWNTLIENSTQSSTIAKKFYSPDHIDLQDRKTWGKQKIPDFYGKYLLIRKQEEELESLLRKMGFLSYNSHLSYVSIATRKSEPSPPSNRTMIEQSEDDVTDVTMYWTKRLLTNTAIGDRIISPLKKIDRPENYKEALRRCSVDASCQEYREQARKIYMILRESAKNIADEVDVYSDMGVYEPSVWKNALSEK